MGDGKITFSFQPQSKAALYCIIALHYMCTGKLCCLEILYLHQCATVTLSWICNILMSLFFVQIYDTIPLLRSLPLPFQNPLRDYRTVKMNVLEIVNEHRLSRTPNEPRDIIDGYLDEMDRVSPYVPIWCIQKTKKNYVACINYSCSHLQLISQE